MARLIREFYDLILDRRTISRSRPFDRARKKRRTRNIFLNNPVRLLRRVGQPARDLVFLRLFLIGLKGKWHDHVVALLFLHLGIIHSPAVHAGGRSGLEAHQPDTNLLKGVGQMFRVLQAVWPGLLADFPVNTTRFQVDASGQNYSLAAVFRPGIRPDRHDVAVLDQNLGNLRLFYTKIVGIFQGLAHLAGVSLLIRLGAEGVNRRTF